MLSGISARVAGLLVAVTTTVSGVAVEPSAAKPSWRPETVIQVSAVALHLMCLPIDTRIPVEKMRQARSHEEHATRSQNRSGDSRWSARGLWGVGVGRRVLLFRTQRYGCDKNRNGHMGHDDCHRRREMRCRRERADIMLMRIVMSRTVLERLTIWTEHGRDRPIHRTQNNGNASRPANIRHPAARQQCTEQHRNKRDVKARQAYLARHEASPREARRNRTETSPASAQASVSGISRQSATQRLRHRCRTMANRSNWRRVADV